MNRFTITMGERQGANIVAGTEGYAIDYYKDGNRKSSSRSYDANDALFANKQVLQEYTYSADGYLTETIVKTKDVGEPDTAYARTDRTVRSLNYAGQTLSYQEYGADNTILNNHYNYIYTADNQKTFERTVIKGGEASVNYSDYAFYANSTELETFTHYDYRDNNPNNNNITTTSTTYAYDYFDSAKQSVITSSAEDESGTAVLADGLGVSNFTYDANGHLLKLDDERGFRYIKYVTNHEGKILSRKEYADNQFITPQTLHNYYLFNNVTIGEWGNDNDPATNYAEVLLQQRSNKRGEEIKPVTSFDFDQNFQPITADYPGNAPGDYVVRYDGESLSDIALAVWGDASLWYLIADANGLNGNDPLVKGTVLTIPNKVTNIHNNASTFRPYQAGLAIGNVAPTLPDPPPLPLVPQVKRRSELAHNIRTLERLDKAHLLDKEGKAQLKEMQELYASGWEGRGEGGGCGGFLSIVVAIVAAVAAVYTAGLAAQALVSQAALAGAGLGGASAFGTGLGILSGSVGGFGAIAAAAIGGAVGSFAGQLAGNILGVQDGFDFAAIATGALSAGLGAGVGSVLGDLNILGKLPTSLQVAAKAGISNAIASQGVNIATGQQKGFNWRTLAATTIAAGVSTRLGFNNSIEGTTNPAQFFANEVASGVVRQGVGILVRERDNIRWGDVASSAISNTITHGLAGQFESRGFVNESALGLSTEDVFGDSDQVYVPNNGNFLPGNLVGSANRNSDPTIPSTFRKSGNFLPSVATNYSGDATRFLQNNQSASLFSVAQFGNDRVGNTNVASTGAKADAIRDVVRANNVGNDIRVLEPLTVKGEVEQSEETSLQRQIREKANERFGLNLSPDTLPEVVSQVATALQEVENRVVVSNRKQGGGDFPINNLITGDEIISGIENTIDNIRSSSRESYDYYRDRAIRNGDAATYVLLNVTQETSEFGLDAIESLTEISGLAISGSKRAEFTTAFQEFIRLNDGAGFDVGISITKKNVQGNLSEEAKLSVRTDAVFLQFKSNKFQPLSRLDEAETAFRIGAQTDDIVAFDFEKIFSPNAASVVGQVDFYKSKNENIKIGYRISDHGENALSARLSLDAKFATVRGFDIRIELRSRATQDINNISELDDKFSIRKE